MAKNFWLVVAVLMTQILCLMSLQAKPTSPLFIALTSSSHIEQVFHVQAEILSHIDVANLQVRLTLPEHFSLAKGEILQYIAIKKNRPKVMHYHVQRTDAHRNGTIALEIIAPVSAESTFLKKTALTISADNTGNVIKQKMSVTTPMQTPFREAWRSKQRLRIYESGE